MQTLHRDRQLRHAYTHKARSIEKFVQFRVVFGGLFAICGGFGGFDPSKRAAPVQQNRLLPKMVRNRRQRPELLSL